MVAGEESKEAEDQEHREKRVSEVVYPSWSTIPPKYVIFGLCLSSLELLCLIYLVLIPCFSYWRIVLTSRRI